MRGRGWYGARPAADGEGWEAPFCRSGAVSASYAALARVVMIPPPNQDSGGCWLSLSFLRAGLLLKAPLRRRGRGPFTQGRGESKKVKKIYGRTFHPGGKRP